MDLAAIALTAKRAADEDKEAHARAQGTADAFKDRIKREYGCKSMKEAQELLKKLEAEEQAAAAEVIAAYKEFEQQTKDGSGSD